MKPRRWTYSTSGCGQFAVAPGFGGRLFLPGTDVDFIDAQGRTQGIAFPPAREPGLVRPGEFAGVPHNGRLFGGHLEEKAEGIGVELDAAVGIANLKLVMRPLPHAGDENLPDAGGSEQAHGMAAAIPVVEITHDADPLGVGCPDRKTGTRHAIDDAQLRAELFINSPFVALVEQEQIGFAQRGPERIGITGAADVAAAVGDHEVVGINRLGQRGDALKHIGLGKADQFERGAVFFQHGLDLDFLGIRHERAHDQSGLIPQRMHAEQRMRRLVGEFNQTAQFIRCQYHARSI